MATRRAVAQFRRDIAELKRIVKDFARRLELLEAQEKRRLAQPVSPERAEGARFSAGWLKKHRRRLGLSANEYATLVGVHPITIYAWEKGRSKPRKEQLAALVSIRDLRKREARMRLQMLGKAG
ncbi:MAG: helix-turn-helix transcriptional regulator [Planctomycetes bacterium]|nr:helix-turn-helix transcriptional regulator [Planctomycetota bacterium]